MPKFLVTFSDKAKMDAITKALKTIPGYKQESQEGVTFKFSADWDAKTPGSLNNLKAKLEATAGGGSVKELKKA